MENCTRRGAADVATDGDGDGDGDADTGGEVVPVAAGVGAEAVAAVDVPGAGADVVAVPVTSLPAQPVRSVASRAGATRSERRRTVEPFIGTAGDTRPT
jgi:hypothetical protein